MADEFDARVADVMRRYGFDDEESGLYMRSSEDSAYTVDFRHARSGSLGAWDLAGGVSRNPKAVHILKEVGKELEAVLGDPVLWLEEGQRPSNITLPLKKDGDARRVDAQTPEQAKKAKKTGPAVSGEVLSEQLSEQQAHDLMERRDEEQIIAEMEGAVLDEMVYSFKAGGREVTGISYAGTKSIAMIRAEKTGQGFKFAETGHDNPRVTDLYPRVMAVYAEEDRPKVEQPSGVFRAEAWLVDNSTGQMGYGTADHPMYRAVHRQRISEKGNKMIEKDGSPIVDLVGWELDPFAYRTVTSKAIRNATRALLPESLIISMIKKWKEEYK